MIILIVVLVILLVASLALSIGMFIYACVRRPDKPDEVGGSWAPYKERVDEGKRWLRDNTEEKIEITTFDGLKVKGLLVPHDNAKGTIIAMHGYRSRSDIDFAPECEFLWRLGYNLLVIMQRSHDESEGKYITFGVKERFDCKSWVEYTINRYGKEHKIFLSGISMGSATVMMATELDLPTNVQGVIADCGYTSPWDIARHVLTTNLHVPPFPIMHITNLIAKIVAKFSFKEASAIGALKKNELPILFIHGGKDDFVPTEMSYKNFAACKTKEKKLVIVESAAHAQAYMADTDLCQREITDFVNKYGTRTTALK